MFARVFAVVACLVGVASFAVFLAYVVGTGLGLWPRDLGANYQLSMQINFGLLMLFAIQHTGMARQSFKQRLGVLGRSFYVGATGIVLLILTLCWQTMPGDLVWHGPPGIVAISLAAMAVTGVCCVWYDDASFLGLTQAWTGVAEIRLPLRIDGPYHYVRHPQMLGFLITIWAQPIMPQELLMLNLGMTAYVLAGIVFEEHDLAREYGAEYEKYRREVPMLIPFLRR